MNAHVISQEGALKISLSGLTGLEIKAFLSNVASSHILCFNCKPNPNPIPNPVNLKAKKLNVKKATK